MDYISSVRICDIGALKYLFKMKTFFNCLQPCGEPWQHITYNHQPQVHLIPLILEICVSASDNMCLTCYWVPSPSVFL